MKFFTRRKNTYKFLPYHTKTYWFPDWNFTKNVSNFILDVSIRISYSISQKPPAECSPECSPGAARRAARQTTWGRQQLRWRGDLPARAVGFFFSSAVFLNLEISWKFMNSIGFSMTSSVYFNRIQCLTSGWGSVSSPALQDSLVSPLRSGWGWGHQTSSDFFSMFPI